MKQTRLRNNFLIHNCEANKGASNAQRTSVSLVRKAKKEYFDSLKNKNITDNKTFWKNIAP